MGSTTEERVPLVLLVVPALMLLAALAPWPYGYYVLLRLVVCLASIAIAWRLRGGNHPILWAFIGLAILYNPVVKVPLGRPLWSVANVISVAPFAYLVLRGRRTT